MSLKSKYTVNLYDINSVFSININCLIAFFRLGLLPASTGHGVAFPGFPVHRSSVIYTPLEPGALPAATAFWRIQDYQRTGMAYPAIQPSLW